MDDIYWPLYKHEEQLILRLINDQDIIDISTGYVEGERVKVVSESLVGMEGNIKRIKRRQGAAIIEMNIFNCVTEVSLGLDLLTSKKSNG